MLVRWGFLPAFVKDPKAFSLLINARAETLTEKASFRAAVKRRRCLVIADGYYEWLRGSGRAGAARSFLIRRANGEPMGFAGLYETWSDRQRRRNRHRLHRHHPAQQADRDDPRADARDHRPERFSLSGSTMTASKPSAATALLRPAPDDWLEAVETDRSVGRIGNDDAEVQRPIAPPKKPPGKAQGELF